MYNSIDEEIGEFVGYLIQEMQVNKTINGEPLPDAQTLEQDDWWREVGERIWKLAMSKYYKARYVPTVPLSEHESVVISDRGIGAGELRDNTIVMRSKTRLPEQAPLYCPPKIREEDISFGATPVEVSEAQIDRLRENYTIQKFEGKEYIFSSQTTEWLPIREMI